MRLDKEDSVQVATINLCGHLLTLDMLEPEECIEMCELVFMDTKKTVSQAAGMCTVLHVAYINGSTSSWYVYVYILYVAYIILYVG